MRIIIGIFIYFSLLILSSCSDQSASSYEDKRILKQSMNSGWKFRADSSDWQTVNIPHTPRIEPLIVNDQWQGDHVYTKTFDVDQNNLGRTFLHFEGVMHECVVYLNGNKVKENKGGYLPFSIDITEHLIENENELKVEVSNLDNHAIPPGKSLKGLDFNYYGGIYRDVWLIQKKGIYVTDPFIENDKDAGWLIHFDEVSEDVAKGDLRVEIRNDLPKQTEVEIKAILSIEDKTHTFSIKQIVNKASNQLLLLPIDLTHPKLWSLQSPQLYKLTVTVSADGQLMDMIKDKVGIRKIELTEKGFFINDEKQFLRGTNRHQEYPYVGYAISNNANYRDALKIKNAGFDFVRLSHYPHDEAFLSACDELGLLVMNAIPGWQHFQEGEFVSNSYQDIRDMIRRDRNHPSVAFWEVSLNESAMSEEFMKHANAILKEELPYSDTYSAGWIDHPTYDLYIPARQHAKPPLYWNNYENGKRNVLIAEYGDWEYYAHNAGFNQTAFENLSEEERNSRQLRSHGEKRLLQQAYNYQEAANSNRKGKDKGTIGHANWLMFDYNRGYADDLEASGISDIFRIPKFAYYFYKSQRSPEKYVDHPLVEDGFMIKIASYWTKESFKKIQVYSNCEQVSLYLNDSLIATKNPTINSFSDELNYPPFDFTISKFEEGELRAIGLVDGNEVVNDIVLTPDDPTNVRIRIDTLGGPYDEEQDLFFVYGEVVDENGTIVPNAHDLITFQIEGKGELIGTNPVKAEAGIATILLKGDPKESSITAIIDSIGIKSKELAKK